MPLVLSGIGAQWRGPQACHLDPTDRHLAMCWQRESSHFVTTNCGTPYYSNPKHRKCLPCKGQQPRLLLSVNTSYDGLLNHTQVSPTWHRTGLHAKSTKMYLRSTEITGGDHQVRLRSRYLTALDLSHNYRKPTRRLKKTNVKF